MKLIYSRLISAFFLSLPNAAIASDDIFVSPGGSDEWESLAKYNLDKALSFDRIKSKVLMGD